MRKGLSRRHSVHTMSAFFCGLDFHKEYTYATLLGPDGGIVAQRKMGNEEVPRFLEPYPVEHVAMEATTSIAPLYRRLTKKGYDIHVAHPMENRSIANARIKTDRISSTALAELLRLDGLPESYMPPPDIPGLWEKVRRQAFLVRERVKLKTKIRSTLTCEVIKPPEGFGLFTGKGMAWLKSLGLEPVDCYQVRQPRDAFPTSPDRWHPLTPSIHPRAHLRRRRRRSAGAQASQCDAIATA